MCGYLGTYVPRVCTDGDKMKKEIVHPTWSEQRTIDRRLRKKHPQMYTESWIRKLKGDVKKELKKQRTKHTFMRTKTVEKSLSGNLSKKEIARLRD